MLGIFKSNYFDTFFFYSKQLDNAFIRRLVLIDLTLNSIRNHYCKLLHSHDPYRPHKTSHAVFCEQSNECVCLLQRYVSEIAKDKPEQNIKYLSRLTNLQLNCNKKKKKKTFEEKNEK